MNTRPLGTVSEEFKMFMDQVLPGGCSDAQRFDMWQAFLAGSLVAFATMTGPIADLEEDAACEAMSAMKKDLYSEAEKVNAINRVRIKAMAAGRN